MQQLKWDTSVMDLSKLLEMGADRPGLVERYLRQFADIVPGRIEKLELESAQQNRKAVRQIVHQMKPQLLFFGLPIPSGDFELLQDTSIPLSGDGLSQLVAKVIGLLQAALREINQLLQTHFTQ
ncbi:MAG: hypothetical protein AAF598_12545 [Bacteroidota bacterium]